MWPEQGAWTRGCTSSWKVNRLKTWQGSILSWWLGSGSPSPFGMSKWWYNSWAYSSRGTSFCVVSVVHWFCLLIHCNVTPNDFHHYGMSLISPSPPCSGKHVKDEVERIGGCRRDGGYQENKALYKTGTHYNSQRLKYQLQCLQGSAPLIYIKAFNLVFLWNSWLCEWVNLWFLCPLFRQFSFSIALSFPISVRFFYLS